MSTFVDGELSGEKPEAFQYLQAQNIGLLHQFVRYINHYWSAVVQLGPLKAATPETFHRDLVRALALFAKESMVKNAKERESKLSSAALAISNMVDERKAQLEVLFNTQ